MARRGRVREAFAFTDDASLYAWIWETTAGRFEWHYKADELVMILEGEVEITPPAGEPFILRKGDLMFVPGRQVMLWNVPVYVKKVAIDAVQPVPPPARSANPVRPASLPSPPRDPRASLVRAV